MKSTIHIFADESRHVNDRFMVLGGISCNLMTISLITKKVQDLRDKYNFFSEFKWTNISDKYLNLYKELLLIFFNDSNVIFKALIIDRQKLNHKQFNQNNKEVGFYKFYYQLILNMFVKDNLESNTKYIIHLDKRKTSYKLEDLKFYLNMGFSSKFKTNIIEYPFRSVEVLDSKKSEILQINDLLIGAIGYYKNEYHLKKSYKISKYSLIKFIQNEKDIVNLGNNTKWNVRDFHIWNITLQ